MQVSLVTQIFSSTYSSALFTMINSEEFKIDESAIGTAILLKFLNDLFDLLNNKHSSEQNVLKKNSIAHLKLVESLKIVSSFEFQTTNKNMIKTIDNFEITINSLIQLQSFLSINYNIEYILTKKFNQDCLENFFAMVRHESNENNNVRPLVFRRVFTVLIYSSFFKRKLSSKKNSYDDDFQFICPNLKKTSDQLVSDKFICSLREEEMESLDQFDHFDNLDNLNNFNLNNDYFDNQKSNLQVCTYISGFVLKKLKSKICLTCFSNLQTTDINQIGLEFTKLKQFKNCNLVKPNSSFVDFVQLAISFFNKNIDQCLYKNGTRNLICSEFVKMYHFSLDQSICESDCIEKINTELISIVFLILVKHFLKFYNTKFSSVFKKTKLFLNSK